MKEKPQGSELIQRLLELSWKPKKIMLQTAGIIVAYLIILLAKAIVPESPRAAWLASIILFVGEVVAYFVILFVMTAVAKITLAELRGGEEVQEKAALGAARSRLTDVITSPIKIFAILAGLVVFHAVIDLWGKIPFIGELCWMFSPFFTFPLGIAMVATTLVLIFGAMLLPTIIALGKEGPVSELIDFLRKNTIKFAGHFIIALIVAIVAFVILGAAIQMSKEVSLTIMGEKYLYVHKHIPAFFKKDPLPIRGYRLAPPEVAVSRRLALLRKIMKKREIESFLQEPNWPPKADRWTLQIAGFVFGVLMWLIHMSVFGFIQVIFGVAGTLSYVGLTGAEEKPEVKEPEVKEEGEKASSAAAKSPRPRKGKKGEEEGAGEAKATEEKPPEGEKK